MNGGISQDARVMEAVLRDMEAAFAPAFDRMAEAAADALYGPEIRQIEAMIAERDKRPVADAFALPLGDV